MKKAAILFLLTVFLAQIVSAQKNRQQAIDEIIAQKGANLFINIDKNLLEPQENVRLSIGILVYNDTTIPGDETPDLQFPDEEILPPENNLYKAVNWKILQGGGNLVGIDATTQTYSAPAKLPADKIAVISVDLQPLLPNLPKVILLQTIYFAENETAFVLNMPAAGIVNQKYVSKLDGGAKLPVVSPQAAKNLPPNIRQQLEEAQKKMEQQSMDMNLTAMTSNAFAYFDKEKGFTAIRFSELGLQRTNGKTSQAVGKDATLTFNFKGKGAGSYDLGEDQTGLGFFRVNAQKGYGCGDTQSETEKYPCKGKIVITEVDAKFVKGTVRATVFTSVGKKIFSGSIYGKFKVNRAN